MSGEQNISLSRPKVNVEYCGVCDYGGHCLALAQRIIKTTPEADVSCQRGRHGCKLLYLGVHCPDSIATLKGACSIAGGHVCHGNYKCSFEVAVNNTLIYSKLQTTTLPDYEEVAQVVKDVAEGAEPTLIQREQLIDCVII